MSLLKISELRVAFETSGQKVRAVDGVSLSLAEGQTLFLVGESGSGKTALALSIARLLASPPASWEGEVLLEGSDILTMDSSQLRRMRGKVVSYVFQEPGAALNPVMRIGSQIKEVLKQHRPPFANDSQVVGLLEQVGIAEPGLRQRSYPHELSGGMQQRVAIALALAANPKLLVADEPTTALDVTTQAQIMALLRKLQREAGMAILFITHNLQLVNELSGQVAVMYAGQVVEQGNASSVLANPLHPYTKGLIESIPRLGQSKARLKSIPGTIPHGSELPPGCRFHPRCFKAASQCSTLKVELLESHPNRWVRCPFTE